MRSACSAMMPRKRSRAPASSRAGPRRVSMKPARPAIGVLSSWLALATKSARMRSARRNAVVSCSTTSASEPSAAARGRRRRWAIMSSSGGPDSTSSTAVWSGPVKLPSAPVSSSPSIAASSCGLAERRRQVALGADRPQQGARREVGAHDAALAVDGDQRIGQAVDDGLRGSREIVDRGALAAPAGGQRRRRRRQLLGGRREGEPRHHRLALVGKLADEAREAGERAQVALHQEDGHGRDGGHGDQRRPARQVARPVERGEGGEGRRQRHRIGRQIAARGDWLGHGGTNPPPSNGQGYRM